MTTKNETYILGISGGFHEGNLDTSAVLLKNGAIVAGVEEERLSRVKHAPCTFPKRAIMFCLEHEGISIRDVDYLAFHMATYANIVKEINDYMNFHFGYCPEVRCVDHHMAHAFGTFFMSGYDEAKIITIDFSGDKLCTTLNHGRGTTIKRLKEYRTPDSLGIFYALLTQHLGFKMMSHEYKVMGLSGYGSHDPALDTVFDKILRVEDKKYAFNKSIFRETKSLQQCLYSEELTKLLGPGRKSFEPITAREKNIAYATQRQFEKACLALLEDISSACSTKNLCLAGGSTLNCVMNSKLLETGHVDNIYVPYGAGDAGTAIGAAFMIAHELGIAIENNRSPFCGPEYTNEQIKHDLDMLQLSYRYLEEEALLDYVSTEITKGKIIGWFQGRAEFGARALGNRSILADPQDPGMQDKINRCIKFRESFRPFAPSVTLDDAPRYFKNPYPAPYMNLTFEVTTDNLPAITHVDGTARVQTVAREDNPLYYDLIKNVGKKSGIPVVLNTSLNIMEQPMACAPREAVTVFGATGMDILVLNNYVLAKGACNL